MVWLVVKEFVPSHWYKKPVAQGVPGLRFAVDLKSELLPSLTSLNGLTSRLYCHPMWKRVEEVDSRCLFFVGYELWDVGIGWWCAVMNWWIMGLISSETTFDSEPWSREHVFLLCSWDAQDSSFCMDIANSMSWSAVLTLAQTVAGMLGLVVQYKIWRRLKDTLAIFANHAEQRPIWHCIILENL